MTFMSTTLIRALHLSFYTLRLLILLNIVWYISQLTYCQFFFLFFSSSFHSLTEVLKSSLSVTRQFSSVVTIRWFSGYTIDYNIHPLYLFKVHKANINFISSIALWNVPKIDLLFSINDGFFPSILCWHRQWWWYIMRARSLFQFNIKIIKWNVEW